MAMDKSSMNAAWKSFRRDVLHVSDEDAAAMTGDNRRVLLDRQATFYAGANAFMECLIERMDDSDSDIVSDAEEERASHVRDEVTLYRINNPPPL